MHGFLHWGDHINWTPVAGLGVAGVLLFVTRMLIVWFYWRRVLARMDGNSNTEAQIEFVKSFSMQKPAVPHVATNLYYLSGVAFIAVTLWGLFGTAWWMVPVGFVAWLVIHRPFLSVMQSWSQFQSVTMAKDDFDMLQKGGLTQEQESVIKRRLGID